jgi:hypothetical protein
MPFVSFPSNALPLSSVLWVWYLGGRIARRRKNERTAWKKAEAGGERTVPRRGQSSTGRSHTRKKRGVGGGLFLPHFSGSVLVALRQRLHSTVPAFLAVVLRHPSLHFLLPCASPLQLPVSNSHTFFYLTGKFTCFSTAKTRDDGANRAESGLQ